jgi:alpha-glucuronidase
VALQDVNGDWTAESKVRLLEAARERQRAGRHRRLPDDDNYVKLTWEMASAAAPLNKLRVVMLGEQNGAATTCRSPGERAEDRRAGRSHLAPAHEGGGRLRGVLLNRRERLEVHGIHDAERGAGASRPRGLHRAGSSTDLDVAFDYFHIASRGDPVPAAAG